MTDCYSNQKGQTFLGQNTTNSGYTNKWLECRDFTQYFNHKYKDYKLIDENPCNNNIANDILKNVWETNPLGQAFFSKENLDHLQDLIIKIIYQRSGGQWVISRQSDNELLVIMRAIFLEKAQFIPHSVIEETADLNKQVLITAVPRIASKIEQHLGFMRDKGAAYKPFTRGELASNKGTKTTRGYSSLFV